jgi:hypothetical protein
MGQNHAPSLFFTPVRRRHRCGRAARLAFLPRSGPDSGGAVDHPRWRTERGDARRCDRARTAGDTASGVGLRALAHLVCRHRLSLGHRLPAGGRTVYGVTPTQLPHETSAAYFTLAGAEVRPDWLGKTTRRLASGKNSSVVRPYHVCPVLTAPTPERPGAPIAVWAVWTESPPPAAGPAPTALRYLDDRPTLLAAVSDATTRHRLISAEDPVFVTISPDAPGEIRHTRRELIALVLGGVLTVAVGRWIATRRPSS